MGYIKSAAAAVAVAAALIAPSAATAAPNPFSSTSFWNVPISASAAVDPLSSTYVANLNRQVSQYGTYMNTTQYSTPVYRVGADQPRVKVTLDNVQLDLKAAFASVPVPDNAVPAVGTDGHMVVWQESTDTMWEFWRMSKKADGWHAVYGGRQTGLSQNVGWMTENGLWGATATSLPLLGGLVRLDELNGSATKINHALALALPETRAAVSILPALRTDGNVVSPTAIPEGARFRIPASVDLSKIPMTPFVRSLAEAAQKYGMFVRDRAGTVALFGEDPTPTGSNPYPALYQGGYIGQQLKAFPWDKLQVMRTGLNG